MSNTHKLHQDMLRDLFKGWGDKTRQINKLETRIGANESKFKKKPSLLGRLTTWMTQLVTLKNKEKDLISHICDIERKHLHLRKTKKLRRVAPKAEAFPMPEPKKKDNFWFWAILLAVAMRQRKRALLSLNVG